MNQIDYERGDRADNTPQKRDDYFHDYLTMHRVFNICSILGMLFIGGCISFNISKERQNAVAQYEIYNLPTIKDPSAYVESKYISIFPWDSEPYVFRIIFQYESSKNVTVQYKKEIKTSSARTYAEIGRTACVTFKDYKNQAVELHFCD